jgi:hypothetical protein
MVRDFLLRKAQERTAQERTAEQRTGEQIAAEIQSPVVAEAPAKLLTPADVASRLHFAQRQVAAQRELIRRTLERVVQDLTGWRPANFREGRETAARIHQLLEANGLRIACPQCSAPAILRCQGSRGRALFVFDHTFASGRTFHGGTPELPRLSVVVKSVRGVRITLRTNLNGQDVRPEQPS